MADTTGKTKAATGKTATRKKATAKTTPAKTAPTKAATAGSTPVKTATVRTAPAKTATAKTAATKASPSKTATRTPRARQPKASPPPAPSTARKLALGTLSIGAIVGAVAAAALGIFKFRRGGEDAGHVPTDLMGDTHPGPEDRAIEAFRPDPTAPIPDSERDAFRPALAGAAAPTLVKGQARENERLDAAPS